MENLTHTDHSFIFTIANKTSEVKTFKLFGAEIPDGIEVKAFDYEKTESNFESYQDFLKQIQEKAFFSEGMKIEVDNTDDYFPAIKFDQFSEFDIQGHAICPLLYFSPFYHQPKFNDIPHSQIIYKDRVMQIGLEPFCTKKVIILVSAEGDIESVSRYANEKKKAPQFENILPIYVENKSNQTKRVILFRNYELPISTKITSPLSSYQMVLDMIESKIKPDDLFFNKLKVYSKNTTQLCNPLMDMDEATKPFNPNGHRFVPSNYLSPTQFLDTVIDCDVEGQLGKEMVLDIEPKTRAAYIFYKENYKTEIDSSEKTTESVA